MNVVSLLPSATEIVCALGRGDDLVERSHECGHPPEVRDLPPCTEPAFEADGTSHELDERVTALLREGLSVYRVHAERLARLEPDLVLTRDQCAACAASLDAVEAAVAEVVGSGVTVLSLSPRILFDVWEDHGRVARALRVRDRSHPGRAPGSHRAGGVGGARGGAGRAGLRRRRSPLPQPARSAPGGVAEDPGRGDSPGAPGSAAPGGRVGAAALRVGVRGTPRMRREGPVRSPGSGTRHRRCRLGRVDAGPRPPAEFQRPFPFEVRCR